MSYTFFEHLQGWGLHSFSKEIFPNIQSTQLQAIKIKCTPCSKKTWLGTF